MPIYIAYFLAAGALMIGGPAVGAALYGRAKRAVAVEQQLRDNAAIERLLESEIDLQHTRDEASRAGVDPDTVVQGYYALRDRGVTIEQVAALVDVWRRE